MRAFRHIALAVLAALPVVAGSGAAGARDVSIAAFFGEWQGSAVSESEISAAFRLTARDLNVTVRPAGAGFSLTWSTVQRQKGDPDDPVETLKTATMTFLPSGRPGVWRAEGAADPLAAPYGWARIAGNTLTVYTMAIEADGGLELQVYDRTLTGLGMAIDFTRLRDGQPIRTAKGRLTKLAD